MYICFIDLDKRKIKNISDYFRASPVLKAYLFGSYVRGEADSQSGFSFFKWFVKILHAIDLFSPLKQKGGQYAPDCEASFKFRGSVSAGLSQLFFYK